MILELSLFLLFGFTIFQLGVFFLFKYASKHSNPYEEYLLIKNGISTEGVLSNYKEYATSPSGDGSDNKSYYLDYSFKIIQYDLKMFRELLIITYKNTSNTISDETDSELIKKLADTNDKYGYRKLYSLINKKLTFEEFHCTEVTKVYGPSFPEKMKIVYLNDFPIINRLEYSISNNVFKLFWNCIFPYSLVVGISSLVSFFLFFYGIKNYYSLLATYKESIKQFKLSKPDYYKFDDEEY